MRRFLLGGLFAGCLICMPLVAQSPFDPQSADVHATNDLSSNGAITAMISPVKGEPYEASKVSHSVWKLLDGTTIRHDSETKIARDGEGRVREDMEHTSASSFGGKQINRTDKSVTVADPVDHSLLIWTGTSKIAMRMELPDFSRLTKRVFPAGGVMGGMIKESAPPPPTAVRLGEPALPETNGTSAKDDVVTEDLGKQSLAGLLVTGKRTTTTIATGKIGNDQPITIVHEEWYSPDLKVVVKSVDSDPRSGERTMELVGLMRGDPDPALFHAPEGYKVQDMAGLMKSIGSIGKPAADK